MAEIVPIRNLYYLYAYAWDQFDFAKTTLTGSEIGPDGTALLVRALISGCDRLFKRGIDRVYVSDDEVSRRVRGKILLNTTLRKSLLEQGMAHCEFDELSNNTLPNRLLKATLKSVSSLSTLSPVLRGDVNRIVRTLNALEVGEERLTRSSFQKVQLNRNNSFYSFLLNICKLLNEKQLPDQEGNTGPFVSILRDEKRMGKLFQNFLTNFYRREQAVFRVQAERIAWDLQELDLTSRAFLPYMYTDLILRTSDQTLVIDAKFYRETLQSNYGKESVHSNHLYQLFSYLKNMEARSGPDANASGMLIYPTVQKEVSLNFGLSGHSVKIETINLTEPWASIHHRLLGILPIPDRRHATDLDN